MLRGALRDRAGAADRTAADLARLHLMHADVHAAQGLLAEEAESLRHAVHALQTSDGGSEVTRARLRLGGCLLALERPDEAAAVLVAALGELLEAADEPGHRAGVRLARPVLFAARTAARRSAVAGPCADLPQPWQDPHGHAVVTHLAADIHRAGGRYPAAAELYGRAEELWRALGNPHAVIRTLHARGWLAMESGAPVEESLRFMHAAREEITAVLHGPEEALGEEQRIRLRLETGHTYRQTAELLIEAVSVPAAPTPGKQSAAALDCYARGIETRIAP